jgi:uncharacterized protein (TIGR02118 family)
MATFIALYGTPADTAAFQSYYHETHLPLAKTIPGLRSLTISDGTMMALAGEAPYLIATLTFDSMADIEAGMASAEGQATAADLQNFASGGCRIFAFDSKAV